MRRKWLVVILGLFVLPEAYAAFGGLVPLATSGHVAYNYNYTENAGSQSESTSLLLGVTASGYIWRPWFATTSLALNVGLSSTNSTSGGSEGTVGTGSFSVGVFPQSRFPFSMSYSKTDSRSQQFQDISQISASTSFRVTRLTLRQSFRPRAHNQLYNAWYSSTDYDGDSFTSNSEVYGLDYQLRVPQQVMTANIAHSGSRSRGGANESSVDMASVGHIYTPSTELGVNSLVSYVAADSGGSGSASTNSQAFSSFFWRPEYRAISISGGVRLSENKRSAAVSRSLSTNLGLGYRISRSLNMSAGVSLSTTDAESTQTLSTTQTVSLSYTGGQKQWEGFSYAWQWSGSAANITTEIETETEEAGVPSSLPGTRQNVASGIGHNLSKSWSVGPASSLAASFSQSASASKNSEISTIAKSLNHGAGLSWSSRGGRGSTHIGGRLNDSRSFGDSDTVFNGFSLTYNTDLTLSRLSSLSGNAYYQATQSEVEVEEEGKTESSSRNLAGGVSYRNTRPFGIYNLRFTTSLHGSKQIDSVTPTSTLRWEGAFSYSLGLLSTSLSMRASESAGGNIVKSMNFQATRTF